MAAVIPAMMPWTSQPRGRSDGVSELQPNSRAASVPLQVYRGSHRHPRRGGRLSTAAGSAGGRGAGTSVSSAGDVVVVMTAPLVGEPTLGPRCGPELLP